METTWRQGPGNGYSYACGCGRTNAVSTALCGSLARCACGEERKVPSLSRLRESVGRDPYEAGAVDEIARLIREGRLPSGGACLLSGVPTDGVATVRVVLPRSFKGEAGRDWKLVIAFGWLLGAVTILLINAFKEPRMEEEGAQVVELPVRLAADRAPKARRLSQRRLRQLLRAEPAYARLLEENPYCRLAVLG